MEHLSQPKREVSAKIAQWCQELPYTKWMEYVHEQNKILKEKNNLKTR